MAERTKLRNIMSWSEMGLEPMAFLPSMLHFFSINKFLVGWIIFYLKSCVFIHDHNFHQCFKSKAMVFRKLLEEYESAISMSCQWEHQPKLVVDSRISRVQTCGWMTNTLANSVSAVATRPLSKMYCSAWKVRLENRWESIPSRRHVIRSWMLLPVIALIECQWLTLWLQMNLISIKRWTCDICQQRKDVIFHETQSSFSGM